MNAIVNFDFEGKGVRVVEIGDEPWFVGVDVCRVLEVANESQALARLDDDERRDGVCTVDPIGREQAVIVVSEAGVFQLVFASRKPAAKRFKRWLAHEVLPALRKYGAYVLPGAPAPKAPTVPHNLRPEEVTAWSSAARAVMQIHGRKAAADFWAKTPLPQVKPGRDVDADPMDSMSGVDCLKHLFRLAVGPQTTMRDLYRHAQSDPLARNRLEACGLKLGARDHPEDVLIADEHPFLRAAFEHTDFAYAWPAALRFLTGARRLRSKVEIDGRVVTATVVPKAAVDNVI